MVRVLNLPHFWHPWDQSQVVVLFWKYVWCSFWRYMYCYTCPNNFAVRHDKEEHSQLFRIGSYLVRLRLPWEFLLKPWQVICLSDISSQLDMAGPHRRTSETKGKLVKGQDGWPDLHSSHTPEQDSAWCNILWQQTCPDGSKVGHMAHAALSSWPLDTTLSLPASVPGVAGWLCLRSRLLVG